MTETSIFPCERGGWRGVRSEIREGGIEQSNLIKVCCGVVWCGGTDWWQDEIDKVSDIHALSPSGNLGESWLIGYAI